jgi:hypothetical protein
MIGEFCVKGRFPAPGADKFLPGDRRGNLALPVMGFDLSTPGNGLDVTALCIIRYLAGRHAAVTAGYPGKTFYFVNHGCFQLLSRPGFFPVPGCNTNSHRGTREYILLPLVAKIAVKVRVYCFRQ